MGKTVIVTTSYDEPTEQLEQCIASIVAQPETEQIIVRDRAPGTELPSSVRSRVVHLGRSHGDWGDCGRAVGAALAQAEGADAICWVDGDNWLQPHHVELLWTAHHQSGAPVVTCARSLHRVDGSLMFVDTESDGVEHCDANCYLVTRAAFSLCSAWSQVPDGWHHVGDRIMWAVVRNAVRTAHVAAPTVCYRSRYAAHYLAIGEKPPADFKATQPIPGAELELHVPSVIRARAL